MQNKIPHTTYIFLLAAKDCRTMTSGGQGAPCFKTGVFVKEMLGALHRRTTLHPFRAPEPLPILNPSNFVPQNGFPVVKALGAQIEEPLGGKRRPSIALLLHFQFYWKKKNIFIRR